MTYEQYEKLTTRLATIDAAMIELRGVKMGDESWRVIWEILQSERDQILFHLEYPKPLAR